MPAYPCDELDEMWRRWIAVNQHAQDIGDWTPLADYYAADATYGWMYQPDEHFMAVGREQIRDWALGFEMLGFDGWSLPVRQRSHRRRARDCASASGDRCRRSTDPTGAPYEVVGIGGSWFEYGGNMQWSWQRDFFDVASAAQHDHAADQDGNVSRRRCRSASRWSPQVLPGHYSRAELPAPIWPVPTD